MNEGLQSLVDYRLGRAREAIQAARLLLQQRHRHACVNRLYYACFYAVSALLLSKELASSRHSGVQALFNKHWIKTGLFPKEMGRFYSTIFDARREADYADMADFSEVGLASWLSEAEEFVSKIAGLTQRGSNAEA